MNLVRCETALSSWTTGILIEMVFITALSGIGLWILQVPLALAHAIIAGLPSPSGLSNECQSPKLV